jgi:diphosphomevalonate decarboxylase
MHAAAMCTSPPLIYWNGATLDCMKRIGELKAAGAPLFFTIDAGPQVKAVCLPQAAGEIARELRKVPGVLDLIVTGLGPGLERL